MNKKNQQQRIVVNGDVKMDTVTIYSDNQIKVTACPWMADRADEVAPDGPLRMKGCTVIEPGATATFRPYNIGSQGSRYKQLFVTEHCTVMQTQGGIIIEKWRFKPAMNATDICRARQAEGKRINAYYRCRKEETVW